MTSLSEEGYSYQEMFTETGMIQYYCINWRFLYSQGQISANCGSLLQMLQLYEKIFASLKQKLKRLNVKKIHINYTNSEAM